MLKIPTNFELKDQRTYVNSSSLCEFLVKEALPLFDLVPADMRFDARFHRLVTKNGILHCQQSAHESRPPTGVSAEFKIVSGARIDSTYDVEHIDLSSPFSGTCRIKMGNFRALFENLIEANKRLHQASLSPNAVKIVNMYMKKVPCRVSANLDDWHTVSIRNIGTRTHNDGLTTLNRLSIIGMDIPEFEMCYLVSGATL